MKLIHYSPRSGLKAIDPANMGQGAPAQENRQGVPDVKRSYWYMEGSEPESIVTGGAKAVYRTHLHPGQKIYDVFKDPDRIHQQLREATMHSQVNPGVVTSDQFLQAVKDAGYHGFMNSGAGAMSNVVALFHPQEVEAEEPIDQHHHQHASLLTKSEDPLTLGHHFIFTTENPMYPKRTTGSVYEVVDRLKNAGENAQLVQGHYGHPETSILVRDPKDVSLLHKLAYAHGQESAIESDGHNHKLFFYNGPKAGKVQSGSGTQWFSEAPDDNYTGLPDKRGTVYFRHNLDGEDLVDGDHLPNLPAIKFDDPWDQAKYDRGGDADYARYNEQKLFPKLRKDEQPGQVPFPHQHEDPEMEAYSKSLFGDVVDDSQLGRHYASAPIDDDMLSRQAGVITPQATLEDLYRGYKSSPHHPRSLAMKYMVHRIENAHLYNGAPPAVRDKMDSEFMAHHQTPNLAKQNGDVTIHALRKYLHNSRDTAKDLIAHKRSLHNFLLTHSGSSIKNINGVPSVALTRGLDTEKAGKDHALASYSDTRHAVLGDYSHRRWVPLKNIWYSYDVGPANASSVQDIGPESEFVVSPHANIPATDNDVVQLVPRDHHSHQMSPYASSKLKVIRGDRMHPQEMADLYDQIQGLNDPRKYELMRHLMNHQDTPENVIRSYINGSVGKLNDMSYFYYPPGNKEPRRLPADLADAVANHVMNMAPGHIHSLASRQPNISPDVKQKILNSTSVNPHTKEMLRHTWEMNGKLAASEQGHSDLQKRSKNVRQQTRNITYDQRTARIISWLKRQGVHARASRQDRFGVGPKQNELLYTPERGSPEHEYAHQLMTPEGMTPREYQKQLGQVTANSAMTRDQRISDENTAFMMQPKLARLAGVSAQDTKNVGMLSDDLRTKHGAAARSIIDSKMFKNESVRAAIGYAGEKHGELVQDHLADRLLSFVHPHDLHAVKATLVNHGYPVDDMGELLAHLGHAMESEDGMKRMQDSVQRLPEMRQKAYSSGAKQAKAFDDHLKNAQHADISRMKRSWSKIVEEANRYNEEAFPTLEKKLREGDFDRIHDAHNEAQSGDPGEGVFGKEDFTGLKHVDEKRGHDALHEAIQSPQVVSSIHDSVDGISPKMVHKIKGTTYMTKPYHENFAANDVESVRHNAPGWATLATKDLYDAGNMSHLAEDVRGGIVNGLPVTLHKFARGFHTVDRHTLGGDADLHADNGPEQYDLARIAIMDFLTNNVDRHSGNLLTSKKRDPEGVQHFKAIDHGLAFGYLVDPHRHGMEDEVVADSPASYADKSGIQDAGAESSLGNSFNYITPQLKGWWKQHRDGIRKSMLQSLAHVSNREMKNHIRSNFMQRLYHMDKLVRKTPDDGTLFHKDDEGVKMVKPDWWMNIDTSGS